MMQNIIHLNKYNKLARNSHVHIIKQAYILLCSHWLELLSSHKFHQSLDTKCYITFNKD